MSSEPKFWMCWCPTKTVPTKKWEVISDAVAEASRLASENGNKVYVLEVIGYMAPTTPPIDWAGIDL